MAFHDEVHSTRKYRLGVSRRDVSGREWIYLKGVASTAQGSWVTYDEAGTTTLLAANAIGPVAVAGAAIDSTSEFGWYCRYAPVGVSALLAANCADNARIGRETADGSAGDGRAAGDEIYNAITRGASTAAGLATVQIHYPFVDDANGA